MQEAARVQPLLSIVIPTRNRVPYAISAISSILAIAAPNLELVVQDNTESLELSNHIAAKVRDSRLRYRYVAAPLSMIDNFNSAVELATGEYVCVIGDDDGVNTEIMEVAEWAAQHGIDAVTSTAAVSYRWPAPAQLASGTAGTPSIAYVAPFSGSIRQVAVLPELRRLLRHGAVDYQQFRVPKLYYGLVARRTLDGIRARSGKYFEGLSPDIYAVVCISCVAGSVVFVDYPLAIAGECPASASVAASRGEHTGRLEDAPLFRNRGGYHWSELVPRVYSPETIWADSALAALKAMGADDIVQELNVPRLVAHCVGYNRGITRKVLDEMYRITRLRKGGVASATAQFLWSLLLGQVLRYGRGGWRRLSRTFGIRHSRIIVGLEDMVAVSNALKGHLAAERSSFARYALKAGESWRLP